MIKILGKNLQFTLNWIANETIEGQRAASYLQWLEIDFKLRGKLRIWCKKYTKTKLKAYLIRGVRIKRLFIGWTTFLIINWYTRLKR